MAGQEHPLMKTIPTKTIEMTRDQGDALWWACDAFFDHCSGLMSSKDFQPDRLLVSSLAFAGNAIRESLRTAGVDRAIERFATADSGEVRTIIVAVIAMDDEFLSLPYDTAQWSSRETWEQARSQTERTTSGLREILACLDELELNA